MTLFDALFFFTVEIKLAYKIVSDYVAHFSVM